MTSGPRRPVFFNGKFKHLKELHCGFEQEQGSTRVHKGPHGSTMVHKGPHGSTWVHMGPQGSTRVHMGPHGSTWVHKGPHGSTWVHMGPQGSCHSPTLDPEGRSGRCVSLLHCCATLRLDVLTGQLGNGGPRSEYSAVLEVRGRGCSAILVVWG